VAPARAPVVGLAVVAPAVVVLAAEAVVAPAVVVLAAEAAVVPAAAVLAEAALVAAEEVPAAAGRVGKGYLDEMHGNPEAAHHSASVVRGQEHVARESS
jgi:hypothetical protein